MGSWIVGDPRRSEQPEKPAVVSCPERPRGVRCTLESAAPPALGSRRAGALWWQCLGYSHKRGQWRTTEQCFWALIRNGRAPCASLKLGRLRLGACRWLELWAAVALPRLSTGTCTHSGIVDDLCGGVIRAGTVIMRTLTGYGGEQRKDELLRNKSCWSSQKQRQSCGTGWPRRTRLRGPGQGESQQATVRSGPCVPRWGAAGGAQ